MPRPEREFEMAVWAPLGPAGAAVPESVSSVERWPPPVPKTESRVVTPAGGVQAVVLVDLSVQTWSIHPPAGALTRGLVWLAVEMSMELAISARPPVLATLR